MEFGEFKEEFEKAIKANETMTFFCSCTVEYSGRAEAFLDRGDRIIIIKGDNTLLIHQPENSSPINYMKAGSSFVIEKTDNHSILKSQNLKLKETLNLELFRVYNFMRRKLDDGQSLELQGTEADMSDMIKNQPELISNNFKPLSREEHTKFGFIDVFGHDGNGQLVVIECKRYSAGLDAVQQLRRYVEKVKDLKNVEVKGIIASPAITPNANEMLKKFKFEWKLVNPPKRLEKYNKNQKNLGEY